MKTKKMQLFSRCLECDVFAGVVMGFHTLYNRERWEQAHKNITGHSRFGRPRRRPVA